MKIYKDIESICISADTAVTVGKFEGLHRGHRELISGILHEKEKGMETMVFRLRIPGKMSDHEILSDGEFEEMLEELGVDHLVSLTLTEEIMGMPAETFLQDILLKRCRMKSLFCGPDFFFGRNREGNIELLKRRAEEGLFALTVPDKKASSGKEISSTLIRTCIRDGRIREANEALGYRYFMKGTVVKGRSLAAGFGFPTANIIPEAEKILPAFGVYAVTAEFDGELHCGIANIGIKPTITDEKLPLLEVNILDYEGDLYGKEMLVCYVEYIRNERVFESLDHLGKQIEQDVISVRNVFSC